MCGLTGFWQPAGLGAGAETVVSAMADTLNHRGPDDSGIWVDANSGIALGHRRLAIVDLSPAGHQPMHSHSARYVLIFNGEIYNHTALRRELENAGITPRWRGHSDTESLLACIEAWGLEAALQSSIGMFALALWDCKEGLLYLARDRLGEKPLYYGWQGNTFLFGSELKAFAVHPAFRREIDHDAVALLLRHNYIPAPYSIWRGVRKLLPGTWLAIHPDRSDPAPVAFWSLRSAAEEGQRNLLALDAETASQELERVLSDAVALQMLADVPLGALLSGGIDSSTIVALMQAQSSQPVRTFSIGFREKAFDESPHAAAVARHLRTDHTELYMSADDVLEAVPRMATTFDEPFADSSQLPTALVMALARRQVTVALSGDGGDELFGGYNRYIMAPKVFKVLRWLPEAVRRTLSRLLLSVPPARWDGLLAPVARLAHQAQFGDKLHKLGNRLLSVRSPDDLYVALVTEWNDIDLSGAGPAQARTLLSQRENWPRLDGFVSRMMALDALTYLPDDILVKVDRAAMAASLETRAPFLDHRVVELAWRLPLSHKIAGDQGKRVLRKILSRHLPATLIDRPKKGFAIPLDVWLRTDLKDWAESLLSAEALANSGLVEPEPVRLAWEQHLLGKGSNGYRLWSVLMLQAWWERHGRGA